MTKITRELLINSIKENEEYIDMVAENKYSHSQINDIINGVIDYCNIDDVLQMNLLFSGNFIPGGSILSTCNNRTNSSMSNCYYQAIEKDSLEGIFEAQKKIARTFSFRGGVGTDITILRPANEKVNNTAETSSGAVSFLPSFTELTKTVCQNGRRGALLISLDIRHPDIIKFIHSKSKPELVFEKDIFDTSLPNISSANITIKLTNEFMDAVVNNDNWTFIFPDIQYDKQFYNDNWTGDYDKWEEIGGRLKEYETVPAVEIFNMIVESNWVCGDPGIAFMDQVQYNTLQTYINKSLKPVGFNPCVTGDGLVSVKINNKKQTLTVKEVVEEFKSNKNIEILSYNEELNKNEYKKIFNAVLTRKDTDILKITDLATDRSIKVTPNHLVYTQRGYIKAKDILFVDELKILNNKSKMIPELLFIEEIDNDDVYDFTVEYNHNFYINDILVHNCGEIPCQEKGGNCLLGAFVLHRYVINPYKEDSYFDFELFESEIPLAVRIMNLFSDINVNKHPLEEQRDGDKFSKRIGIEVTGIADMFAMMNMKYGSLKSVTLINDIMFILNKYSIKESIQIAKEKGCCEAFDSLDKNLKNFPNDFILLLDDNKEDFIKYGMYNSALTTIGPCGSISILSDNCSSGIEPIFNFSYTRKNRIDNKEYKFIHYLACKHMLENFDEFDGLSLDEAKEKLNYVESHELDPELRINIQSFCQRWIDASISSTINLPSDATKQTIFDIFMNAWKSNLKGITVFRNGCKDGVFGLSSNSKLNTKDNINSYPEIWKKDLLDTENSIRHRVLWKKSKLYINVSIDENNKPIEIFAKLPKEAGNEGGIFNLSTWQERTSNWDGVCRLISMGLRYNIPLLEIIQQLEKSSYTMFDAGSILKRVLSQYFENEDDENFSGEKCPECSENEYFRESGCLICRSCGYSKCS